MRTAAILVLAFALAGCSTGRDGGEEPESVRLDLSDRLAAEAPATESPGPLATDTLYLALPARLNATSPANLTILGQLSGPMPQSFAWNATLNGTGRLASARLLLWIDLQNSAVQTGLGGDPGCSVGLSLTFTVNGTAVTQPGGCASLGTGLVPPGDHLVELATPITLPAGVAVQPGDGVVAQVSFGFALPQGVGFVLGGGDYPSSLRLTGLAEPVPANGAALL